MARSRTRTTPATQPRLLAILADMADNGNRPATAADLGTNAIYMGRLRDQGLVTVVDKVMTGRQGRPALIYKATPKGYDRGRRAALRRQGKVAA